MQKGDCFKGDITDGTNRHYWIVLCDPKPPTGQIALVNVTTGSGGKKAQKITQKQCPGLDYDSELNWTDSVVTTSREIDQGIQNKAYEVKPSVNKGTVDLIVAASDFKGLIPKDIRPYVL